MYGPAQPSPAQLLVRVYPYSILSHWRPQAQKQMAGLYELFLKTDATQVEINPFAETPEGEGMLPTVPCTPPTSPSAACATGSRVCLSLRCGHLVYCVDAKINFDDNASFRQKAVFDMGDDSETDQREVEAAKYGLNYIGMDGNIGCMGT